MVLWSTQIREGKMMRKSVWMALAVSAALLFGGPVSFAGEHKISGSFLMGTGSATGNYYAFGSALAQVINRHTFTTVRIALAILPCLPITLPISSSATLS